MWIRIGRPRGRWNNRIRVGNIDRKLLLLFSSYFLLSKMVTVTNPDFFQIISNFGRKLGTVSKICLVDFFCILLLLYAGDFEWDAERRGQQVLRGLWRQGTCSFLLILCRWLVPIAKNILSAIPVPPSHICIICGFLSICFPFISLEALLSFSCTF
jgi:hypothetical protein